MISDEISHLIDERCKVALAAILTVKDREIDHRVPDDVSVELRRAVLREVNGFKEFVLEILASAQTHNLVLNQLWLDDLSRKLDDIYDAVSNGTGRS